MSHTTKGPPESPEGILPSKAYGVRWQPFGFVRRGRNLMGMQAAAPRYRHLLASDICAIPGTFRPKEELL
jgi:hypothetical protein